MDGENIHREEADEEGESLGEHLGRRSGTELLEEPKLKRGVKTTAMRIIRGVLYRFIPHGQRSLS